jgi:hypothetical protein
MYFKSQVKAGVYKRSVNDYQTRRVHTVNIHPGFGPSKKLLMPKKMMEIVMEAAFVCLLRLLHGWL